MWVPKVGRYLEKNNVDEAASKEAYLLFVASGICELETYCV